LYYAISGNSDEDCHQGFKHVIKDEIFYKENVYKWFPNPNIPKEELTRDKKKLLGVSIEKEGYVMFAIAPKCYILKFFKDENDESVKKMKRVFFRFNDNIELESYRSCLEQYFNPVMGINRGFMVV
jgi:predicted HTH transcriptional regulator